MFHIIFIIWHISFLNYDISLFYVFFKQINISRASVQEVIQLFAPVSSIQSVLVPPFFNHDIIQQSFFIIIYSTLLLHVRTSFMIMDWSHPLYIAFSAFVESIQFFSTLNITIFLTHSNFSSKLQEIYYLDAITLSEKSQTLWMGIGLICFFRYKKTIRAIVVWGLPQLLHRTKCFSKPNLANRLGKL